VIGGLQLGNINGDAFPDVVVLVKASGFGAFCPANPPAQVSRLEGEIIVLFNPANPLLIPDGDNWTEMVLSNPYVSDRWIHNHFPGVEFKSFEEGQTAPEWNGFTDLVVADFDGNAGDEIVVVLNPAVCTELGQEPPINTVDLWINPGPATAIDPATWGVDSGDGFSRGSPITLVTDLPQIKDIEASDVDGDGDLDIIVTVTNAISQNIRWVRNPLIESGFDSVIAAVSGPGVNVCSGGVNDKGPCDAHADCVGIADGVCLGGVCAGGPHPGSKTAAVPLGNGGSSRPTGRFGPSDRWIPRPT
jgi:hypothetical protein